MTTAPSGFRGDWITPEHEEYTESISRWAMNAERRAAAVAFVKDAEDVAVALKHAQAHAIPICIRGGGHSSGGASSIENGIVIDLSRHLAGVRVDSEKKLAYVGGGAFWSTVDKTCIEHGLATVAGTVNHTGVGGQVDQQSKCTKSNRCWTIWFRSATLVTADQTIRTVNAEQNADLYWAIRGAGSNFGVVTEFVLQLHPQRRTVFAGMAMYPADALNKIMPILMVWCEKGLDEKEVVVQGLTKGPDGKAMIMMVFFWNGSEAEGRAHFKEFFDIGPSLDLCKEMPFEDLNGMQDYPHGRNYYMAAAFVTKPNPDLAAAVLTQINEVASNGVTAVTLFEYVPFGKVLEVSNTATAYIRGPRFNCVTIGAWDEGGKERVADVRPGIVKVIDLLLQSEKDFPIAKNTGYGNYMFGEAAPGTPLESRFSVPRMFGENYARLQELKRRYDPDVVFSKWCPIVPAM